jgi:hypothetical protein
MLEKIAFETVEGLKACKSFDDMKDARAMALVNLHLLDFLKLKGEDQQ